MMTTRLTIALMRSRIPSRKQHLSTLPPRFSKNEDGTLKVQEPRINTHADIIGPPNQVTNLRPVKFYIPPNESPIEREFRLEREKVQRWNEDFWARHNTAFIKESEEFRDKKLQEGPSEKKSLNAEEMSVFYKSFLDKNWDCHVKYNFQWYAKNAHLVYLALKVKFYKLSKFTQVEHR